MSRFLFSLLLLVLLPATYALAMQPLTAVKIAEPVQIDGLADEAFWAELQPLVVHDVVADLDIELKAAHDGERLYLLASYPDADESRIHRGLVWNAPTRSYQNGPSREDCLVLKWSMSGADEDLSLSADHPYRADIWFWKADRTDHAGYADDKMQYYSTTRDKKSLMLLSKAGKVFYLVRKGDQGSSAYRPKLQSVYAGERIPKYEHVTPSGSRADIRAKGQWQAGRWTIELARKLQTGHPDDLQMEVGGRYRFGVSRFEIAGRKPEAATVSDEPLFGSGEVGELIELSIQ